MAILQLVRQTVRSLLRTPGFTVVSVAVLALGIGANTAIFSVLNAVLLRPLPYPNAGELVEIVETSNSHTWSVSYPDFVDWRSQADVFENMAITSNWPVTLAGAGEAERVMVSYVSGSFLRTLGVAPALGRDFLPDEDRTESAPVVILSHGFWQRRLGGEPNAIGRTLTLDGKAYTVVGVLKPSFRFHRPADLYAPFAHCIDAYGMEERGNHNNSWVIARRKPGVTMEQAQARMDGIAAQLAAAYPASNTGIGAQLRPLREAMVGGRSRRSVLVLFGAVAFVLLIACANMANLLLARSAARRKEIAVRAALGATRARLVFELLVESVALAAAGGALGLYAADTSFRALVRLLPHGFEAGDIRIDAAVLGFSVLVSLLTGIVFGLAPALQISRSAIAEGLKEGGRQAAGVVRTRLRGALVVAEVAMALVLLAGAGLLMRSFTHLLRVETGFNPEHVLAAELSWPSNPWATANRLNAFQRELVERARALPGVISAGGVWPLPFGGGGAVATFWVEGKPIPARGQFFEAGQHVATPDYFRAMGIPLLRGRLFTEADGVLPEVAGNKALMEWFMSAELIAVVNATMAERHWPGEDPVGKRIRWGTPERPGPVIKVVGVVGDCRDAALEHPSGARFYLSAYQMPRPLTLVLRTEGDPEAMAGAVRSMVKSIHSGVPVTRIRSMERAVADSVAGRRANVLLLGAFAALAVALAAIGIYGVTGYTVSQRAHEIGIRMALGADRRSVLGMVLGRTALLAVVGVAIGVIGALALTRVLGTLLFGVGAADPVTFAAVSALLIGVALLAGYVPARRATRVDPVIALRQE